MRTGTIIGVALTTIVGVIALSAVVVAHTYANRPIVEAVSPAPNNTVNGDTPIRVIVRSPDAVEKIRIFYDGIDISARSHKTPAGYMIKMPDLKDGAHTVTIEIESSDLLDSASTYQWTFNADATAPILAATTSATWTDSAEIKGTSEPGATITAEWQDGQVVTQVDSTGHFELAPAVPDGATPVVLTATDPAGNETRAHHVLRVDTAPPKVNIELNAKQDWVRDTDRPKVYAFVESASPSKVVAKINGQAAKVTPFSIGYTIEPGKLPQGRSELTLYVTNATGKTATRKQEININSTETLTNHLTLVPGAQGRDVARLTRRLKVAGFWTGRPSWVYNKRVEAAVRAFQKQSGLPEDGITRPALLAKTMGKVVIIKSKFVLNLYIDGKFVKQYPVAIGMPAYPTPTGNFVITEKLENPTWIPPNSPWAAGLETVPPGANNPLGTRWIGTTAPLIGIHGTPQSWTIGTAVSHGCIRMHMADVEELFERVTVGMPIEFKP